MHVLFAYATPLEGADFARRLRADRDLVEAGLVPVQLGMGKAAAAARLAALLATSPSASATVGGAQLEGLPLVRPPGRVDAVVLFGACGAFPVEHRVEAPALQVGDVCLVAEDRMADEGVAVDGEFLDFAQPERSVAQGSLPDGVSVDGGPFSASAELCARASGLLGGVPAVSGATVSSCSGTDAASAAVAERTGACVESMEGAAVAMVCAWFGVPWLQVRAVGNLTGNRARAPFAMPRAVEAASEAAFSLAQAFAEGDLHDALKSELRGECDAR